MGEKFLTTKTTTIVMSDIHVGDKVSSLGQISIKSGRSGFGQTGSKVQKIAPGTVGSVESRSGRNGSVRFDVRFGAHLASDLTSEDIEKLPLA